MFPLQSLRASATTLLVVEILVVILFATCTKEYIMKPEEEEELPHFSQIYQMFTGILIMMLFGFGYLMTFLSKYGLGAVGFTMLITVLAIQVGILIEGFFKKLYHDKWDYIVVDLYTLMDSLFLAASILISFGGVIGKINPLQIIVMTLLGTFFYSLNKVLLVFGVVDLVDAGGTVNIHMFGAYFGLSIAYILGPPPGGPVPATSSVADIFSLIGTVFLWVYWPSFNAGVMVPDSPQHQRSVICTVLALSASTMGTFITSMFLSNDWRIRPVDIQNATLAGGVAVGAICHMKLAFSDSLVIGLVGGMLSTLGYARIQPFLEELGLHDSCGINNLHGMPSLLGGIASVILVAYKGPKGHDYPAVLAHQDIQWHHQALAILFTLAVALSSGIATGFILRYLKSSEDTTPFYEDGPYWEVAGESAYESVSEGGDKTPNKKKVKDEPQVQAKMSAQIIPFESD